MYSKYDMRSMSDEVECQVNKQINAQNNEEIMKDWPYRHRIDL